MNIHFQDCNVGYSSSLCKLGKTIFLKGFLSLVGLAEATFKLKKIKQIPTVLIY